MTLVQQNVYILKFIKTVNFLEFSKMLIHNCFFYILFLNLRRYTALIGRFELKVLIPTLHTFLPYIIIM